MWKKWKNRSAGESMFARVFILSLILICLLMNGGWSLDTAGSSANLEMKRRLEKEIEGLTKEYEQIQTSQSAVMDEVERLKIQSEILSREVKLIRLRLAETRATLQQVRKELKGLNDQLATYQTFIERRILALAKLGPSYPLKILLSIRWGPDMMRAFFYSGALARLDQRVLKRYRKLIRQLEERQTYLAELEASLDHQNRELSRRQQELAQVRRRKERILAELRQRGEIYRQALQELTMAYHRLKEYVGQSAYRPLLNIEKFKGLLDWPVQGPIIRRFGKVRLPDTGTYIISRGIQIRVPEGTRVRAVFDGKVRYADWYTAYGKLIILDHGNDIYSLYAHNQMLLVKKGDVVRRGQVIAISGQTASLNGPMLYFEIRRRVNAEDPLEWLKIQPSWAAR